jgi:prephenate dehydrogenase
MRHLVIIGPGLIGKSIALAARRAQPDLVISEIDRGDSLESVRAADLVVLAAPVDAIIDTIHRHADILRTSVTSDTGSTKHAIVAAAQQAGLADFVGGHPLAGGATSGPAGARADLFDRRPWFLIEHRASDRAVQTMTQFVSTLGASPVLMSDDGDEHDRVMAAVSHLPQIVASALMATVANAAVPDWQWAGSGLRDTTRLAQSSGAIWQSIVETNARHLRPLLRTLARDLTDLADRLGDGEAVTDVFRRARQARRSAFGNEDDNV